MKIMSEFPDKDTWVRSTHAVVDGKAQPDGKIVMKRKK